MQVPGGIYQKVVMQGTVATTGVVTGISAVGNGTAIECTRIGEGAYTALALQVTGITTATIAFEVTIDGSTWVGILAENVSTGAEATTTTANGIFRIVMLGAMQVRARIGAWTTGAVIVIGVATA